MKTGVVMKSEDRKLFGIAIRQETKNGFMSVTELQEAYEEGRKLHGWSDIDVSALMRTARFQERLYYVLSDKGFIKTSFVGFKEQVTNDGIVKVLKDLGLWKTSGRGSTRMVMTDPYIWVALALELNPMIYAKVITFLTDNLIADRNTAGDEFKPMNTAIKSILPEPDYAKYAMAVNKKVFGKHETGMRNLATIEQLQKIIRIEQYVTNAINSGFVKSDADILKAIETCK